jgi:broad specificity phosphatase PhoE
VLLLVRHGRTAHNASRRLVGRLDVPLDELGRRQATALGTSAQLHGAHRVVCSPLRRARDTAKALGPPVTVDDRWTEIDYGIYDGQELEAVPDLWQQWGADIGYVPEGGESLAAVGVRVRTACDDLWAEAAERDVVVVSHVSPLKAAVAWALGVGDETVWRMFVDVASVTCVGPGRPGRPASYESAAGPPGPVLRTFNDIQYRPSG